MPNYTISLKEAQDMTAKFRENQESVLDPEYRERNILPICETFSRDVFDKLLALSGCTQIRIYSGMNENLQVHAIIVAVDQNGDDILPPNPADAIIVETGIRCPDICPVNPL